MLFYLLGILSILKTFSPYMRKHVLSALDTHEYLVLNTIMVCIIVAVYLLHKVVFGKESVSRLVTKYSRLSNSQMLSMVAISLMTVASSVVILGMEQYYENTVVSSSILKTVSTVALVCTGVIIFKEKYSWTQLIGIALAVAGGVLMVV